MGYPTTTLGRLPSWSASYLTTTSGSYTGNIKIGANHVAGSPFLITSASVTVSPFRIVCGSLSTVSGLVTTSTVGNLVSFAVSVKDMWGSDIAFFDSVMLYTPVIPYALYVVLQRVFCVLIRFYFVYLITPSQIQRRSRQNCTIRREWRECRYAHIKWPDDLSFADIPHDPSWGRKRWSRITMRACSRRLDSYCWRGVSRRASRHVLQQPAAHGTLQLNTRHIVVLQRLGLIRAPWQPVTQRLRGELVLAAFWRFSLRDSAIPQVRWSGFIRPNVSSWYIKHP